MKLRLPTFAEILGLFVSPTTVAHIEADLVKIKDRVELVAKAAEQRVEKLFTRRQAHADAILVLDDKIADASAEAQAVATTQSAITSL